MDVKDLDDVVYIKLLDNGYFEFGVYIVDVLYYVIEGFVLNCEVFSCGMFVYVIDCVVLMLLECLFNGICLLNLNFDCLM